MDPKKAPNFKPLSPDQSLHPLPVPKSRIPKSGPIVPFVLADYNSSIDAPFDLSDLTSKNTKKNRKTSQTSTSDEVLKEKQRRENNNLLAGKPRRHRRIPLLKTGFQPLSTEASTDEEAEEDMSPSDGNSIDARIDRLGQKSKVVARESAAVESGAKTQPTTTSSQEEVTFRKPDVPCDNANQNNKSNHTSVAIGVRKNQIADLEEVPHGIVRQARNLIDYEFPTHRLMKRLQDPNKLPLVIVACGSFSPITYLHLRMFEMALDDINEQTRFEVVGGYYSPVSDNYQKAGLAPSYHRVRMCELACERTSSWLMVDSWESLQPSYTRTAKVLDHFNEEINIKRGGVSTVTGERLGVKIMLLAGGDLIESMGEPNVWADSDLHHILGNYGCLIVERTGSDVRSFLLSHDIMYEHRRNVLVIKQLIYNDISSTKVRLFIRRGMSVQYLLPNSVIRYIQEHKLYINQSEPVKQVIG